MKKSLILAVLLGMFLSVYATAEIEQKSEKIGNMKYFCWWPKIDPPADWHHEPEFSLQYKTNIITPDGFTFADAETVLYAKAAHKQRMPETKSVDMLIDSEKAAFLEADPGIMITEVSSPVTGNGQKLRSFTFFPKEKGDWVRISYCEEGDFFLSFTLSARTKSGFEKVSATYEEWIRQYKRKP